jgi:phosphatidate cytidylyltransferase
VSPDIVGRLFGYEQAFADPVTRLAVMAVVAVFVLIPLLVAVLSWRNYLSESAQGEIWRRYRSWLIIAPLMLLPILAGAFWTILGLLLLSLACCREFGRATGLFREQMVCLVVIVGILFVFFAVLDHWYSLFQALAPLTVAAIAAVAILSDRPRGYIQRVALAVFAFLLFGICLGHLAYMANDLRYRPIMILILLSVELNDVFGYMAGKTLGRRQLTPNTSPNKTVEGALGALVLTIGMVVLLGAQVFRDTPLDSTLMLVGLGALISAAGQLGDLMLSSIKRDLGLKDMGIMIPGHGGLLDRFDSLILVAPAAFHYIGYFVGFGLEQQERILTGS